MTGKTKHTLSQARASYGAALPMRLEELAREIAKIGADPTRESIDEAAFLAHRLRGTAATYGFVVVGESAGRIEDALRRLVDSDAAVHAHAHEVIEVSLAGARRSASSTPPPDADETPNAALGVTTKLLLVDDDPAFLEYVEALGRTKLVQILSAKTIDDALDIARRHKPQAAIVDIHLGGTELSFRLARELPRISGCASIRIAFISGSASFDDRVETARVGAALYLTKPIDATAFDLALQQLLAFREPVTPRMVVLDPSSESRLRTLALLSDSAWQVRAVETPSALLSELDARSADLLLATASPESFDACRAVRTSLRWQDLPTIFLTDQDDEAERFAAFEAGADDYIVRPVPSEELAMRLRLRMDRARLAREVAGRDRLTGLPLRGAFLDHLAVRLSEAQRHRAPLSIALIDLDQFKDVNDTHGHLAGDQVLLALARLLSSRLRAEDIRARWGGEEFLIAFPRETTLTVSITLSRLLHEFSQHSFVSSAGAPFAVTFSAGVASFGDDGIDIESLLVSADRRLYAAKRRGRNRIVGRDDPQIVARAISDRA